MTIKRYREKPPEYEAIQFTGSLAELEEFIGPFNIATRIVGVETGWTLTPAGGYGAIWFRLGNWVARDVRLGGLSVWTDDEWRARMEESPS